MNKSVISIVAAILIAALLIVFGPPALERFQQAQRDESLDCITWRLSAGTLSIKELNRLLGEGPGVTYEEKEGNERERQRYGCSPRPM